MIQSLLALLAGFLITFAPGCRNSDAGNSGAHKVGIYVAPTGLAISQIYIDPANSSGCAADQTGSGGTTWGTSATCTGSNGPLKSWWGLANGYWGCANIAACYPRLRQNTTVTFISSHTDDTDPVYARPYLEAGAWSAIVGQPTQLCTGALTALTALTRSTAQLLNITLPATCAGLVSAQNLVVNATHPGESLLYQDVSGLDWSSTQPIAAATLPPTIPPSEVTTWASGDIVTVYSLPSVNIVDYSPVFVDLNQSTFNNYGTLQKLIAYDPNGANADYATIGGGVSVQDAVVQRNTAVTATGQYFSVFANVAFTGSTLFTSPNVSQSPFVLGGVALQALNGNFIPGSDIILGASSTVIAPVFSLGIATATFGPAYIASAKTLAISGAGNTPHNANTIFYGPGALNITGNARMTYPVGASEASATFLQSGTFELNGQTKACLAVPGAASAFAACNITLSAANADTNLGATSGCLTTGTAAICNY